MIIGAFLFLWLEEAAEKERIAKRFARNKKFLKKKFSILKKFGI